jgi:hypothetical protein
MPVVQRLDASIAPRLDLALLRDGGSRRLVRRQGVTCWLSPKAPTAEPVPLCLTETTPPCVIAGTA